MTLRCTLHTVNVIIDIKTYFKANDLLADVYINKTYSISYITSDWVLFTS